MNKYKDAASTQPNRLSSSSTEIPSQMRLGLFSSKAIATFVVFQLLVLALFHYFKPSIFTPFSILGRNMSTVNAAKTDLASSALKITPRRWSARGHADHGWLYTFHTFSFASYYDPKFESYGPLRVINEDRVERGTGFGTHSHAEFLIWSYIVSGELEHKDSMGNLETLRRGQVQFTSAGTGIRHSEYNRNKQEVCHSLAARERAKHTTHLDGRTPTSSRSGPNPTSAVSLLPTTRAHSQTR